MNLRIIKTILAKELLDMLRDKRTLVVMIGIPVVMYPALLLFASQIAIVQLRKTEEAVSRVAIQGEQDPTLLQWLSNIEKIKLTPSGNPSEDLKQGQIDVVIIVDTPIEKTLEEGCSVKVTLNFDATETASRKAVGRITDLLDEERDRLLEERVSAAGLTQEYVTPLDIEKENVASKAKTTGAILGVALPIMFIFMLVLGAFYPAINLTAGEKERGTFETLLSTPTASLDIVTGKFLAVFFLSMTTGLLNLASMGLTVLFQLMQFDKVGVDVPFAIQFSPQTLFVFLLVLIPLALFISALMMSVAMFARDLKEAEFYLTPFMLLTMFPAALATIPGTKLSAVTEFIPIANVALLFKQLMIDSVGLQSIFSVLFSTAIYAVLSLLFAVWIFQREDVILSEERGIPLTLKRSAFVPRETPTPGMALVLFSIVMLLIFYVGALAQSAWLIPGLLITEWGLILLPILGVLWYVRIDLVKSLNLRLPSVKDVAGAMLVGVGTWFLVIQVSLWFNKVLPVPPEFIKEMEKIFVLGNETGSLALLLFAVAVSPAICEEVLFRGVLLSGFRKKMPAWAVILVVGALFGLFHLSIYRIFLTGLLGIVLTYLVLRTGSIWTGVVAHFINNGLAVLIATESLPSRLLEVFNETQIEQQGLPKWLLAVALIVFVCGIAVVETSARKRNDSFG